MINQHHLSLTIIASKYETWLIIHQPYIIHHSTRKSTISCPSTSHHSSKSLTQPSLNPKSIHHHSLNHKSSTQKSTTQSLINPYSTHKPTLKSPWTNPSINHQPLTKAWELDTSHMPKADDATAEVNDGWFWLLKSRWLMMNKRRSNHA